MQCTLPLGVCEVRHLVGVLYEALSAHNGCLVGCFFLVGWWLVGLSGGWLFFGLVGWLVGWLVGCPASRVPRPWWDDLRPASRWDIPPVNRYPSIRGANYSETPLAKLAKLAKLA